MGWSDWLNILEEWHRVVVMMVLWCWNDDDENFVPMLFEEKFR